MIGITSRILLVLVPALLAGCARRGVSADRISAIVETFLISDDDAKLAPALAEAKAIFQREGIPTVAQVGDGNAYGFVLVNMLGQPPEFRNEFVFKLRQSAARGELPADAIVLAEARLRQSKIEERFQARSPSEPALRGEILRLLERDQAVRRKEGFDGKKMQQADRGTEAPLQAIFQRYGVPTYDMVGAEAAKGFAVMVQHQSPEFREAVLPKLKANVDAGQGDPGSYAMVYDRTQRDRGRNQLYGEQLECSPGKSLDEVPIDAEETVNMRRAQLGLIRVELYARLVRLHSPDMCRSGS